MNGDDGFARGSIFLGMIVLIVSRFLEGGTETAAFIAGFWLVFQGFFTLPKSND